MPSLATEMTSSPETSRVAILGHILQFAATSPPLGDVVVLVDSTDGSVTFIEGTFDATDSMIFHKENPLPASKSFIESMPVVIVLEEGTECAICLAEFEIAGEGKLMPCKHIFHEKCIEKWLEINGSCPVCRYKMPVDNEVMEKAVMSVFHVVFGPNVGNLNSDLESDDEGDELAAQDMVTNMN